MSYLRSLFLNFLVVFFIDRMVPGMEVAYYEQVPNIGADILFSAIVGFLNASVFPCLFILGLHTTKLKIAILTFLITFTAFTVISVISFGVQVTSVSGFLIGGLIVWAVAFFTNFLEFDRDMKNLK